ncbi:MAG: DNA polymerase III subunit delta [Pirellulales bacterium]
MSKGTHCFDYLFTDKLAAELPPVVVAFGEDAFLRRSLVSRLIELASVDMDDAKTFDGETCHWRDVHDELATVSLFHPDERRTAIVKLGDAFVKAARPQLEKWFSDPVPTSLLLLEVSSFPGNTKLYKIAAEKGLCVDCSAPKGKGWGEPVDAKAVQSWIKKWSSSRYKLHLTDAQCALILDRVGSEFGLLDQELAKGVLYADASGKLDEQALKLAIGSWRMQTVWEITAAAVDGRIGQALDQLHKLFQSGESPMAVVPQMSWSLRRFGIASHLVAQAERTGRRPVLRDALTQAGFRSGELSAAEVQLRRIGRARGLKLLDWLLELDLKLKGTHSKEDRAIFALEEFLTRLAD